MHSDKYAVAMATSRFQAVWQNTNLTFDSCTVYGYSETEKEDYSTGFEETVSLENIPCRLSYVNSQELTHGQQTEAADNIGSIIKLFLAPSYKIAPGSKIKIKRLDRDLMFKSSGESIVYPSHQEIGLELYNEEA